MKTVAAAGSVRGSCWDDVALELPIPPWNDEVTIALLDASLRRSAAAVAASSARRPSAPRLGDVPDRRHTPGSRRSTAAARAAAATAAAAAAGRRCACAALGRSGTLGRQSRRGSCSTAPRRPIRRRRPPRRRRPRADRRAGGARRQAPRPLRRLKGEFEPEYVTYCAKVAGYVTLTVGAVIDFFAWRRPPGRPARRGVLRDVAVARGDGWDETFELGDRETRTSPS